MVFQIGFTSSSFALERTNYNGIMNYEYREYTLDDLVNCEICEEMSKEEILVFLDFLNNPKVREANNRLIKSLNKSDRVSRMQWYQTPDLIGGLIKGVYEEIGATVEGFLSLLDPSTYEAMMDFCTAISSGEIGLDELQEIIWSDLECVVYVIDNTFYVFDPDSSVSGEEVNEYGKNLAKTIIKILDAKSMLKELPESIGKFNSFLDDFGGITGNVVNHKRPKIDIDLDDVADIVDENEFDMNLQLFASNRLINASEYADMVSDYTYIMGEYAEGAQNSKILRGELTLAGVPNPPYKNAAHHIVPGTDSRASSAREILDEFDIEYNSASNGVFLPMEHNSHSRNQGATLHVGNHSASYVNEVNRRLNRIYSDGADRDDIISELNSLREELLDGTLQLND
jgi:hypothetical protein